MKRTALIFYLIAAALSVRADYETLPVEADEAMGEFIRFESRTWAAEMSGEGGRLAASTTWTGEHVILNDVYVPSGVTLTLGPGAKVKFCMGTRIKVEDGGAIVLNGAEGEEVVLTGFADVTTFAGIVLQSSSASYSDNGYVVADGFAFGKFATVSLSDTTAFAAGGQAVIPVSVSGSRESAFSFDWVAETNGVAFASGSMGWSRVGDGTKNIVVPFDSASFAALGNFTVRASLLRCCNASKPASIVTLSEFLTSDIQTDEAMGDFIRFESREWTTNFTEVANAEGGRLPANTVWSNEHVIVSSVYIPSGVTLTLTADTVVRFCEGTMIKIEDGGVLNIVGADGHDVILRGYEGDTKYTGIVKMSSGTLTDNSYVRVDGFTLGTLANVALNNSSSFRSSGLALIPVTVSGSRDSSFSIDWVSETNGAPYKSGTMLWNRVSDGTKNISISYGAELDGLDKFTIRVVVHRACYANPDSCEVKISDFIVADIQTDEAMGDFIRFESRDWTTNFADVANAEGGRLAANTTWTGEHVILSDVYIPSGVTLTLAADALVRFCEGTMIKIEDGGALNVVGAKGHDVIIRNYDVSTTSRGIVKMSSGTYTDNMYVQYPDFRYGNYPDITLHDAGVGRDAGKIYIPITLDGTSRSQAFNVDWETDKGASGTISWSQSSEGTKWIEIPVDAATFGGTETYGIRLMAARGANLAVADAKVTIYEFNHPVTETVSVTEGTEPSNEFAVNGDIREQPIFLNEVETVRYSGKWQTFDANEAAKLRVSIESDNGVKVLKEAGVDETGEFAFRPEDYPVGHYTLKHEIVDKVGDPLASMSKAFSVVDREDVVMHGGTLTSNETWKAGMVHVVYESIYVPAAYTLFIEPGAIVKFLTGTGIELQTGAALFANAIVFTHIDDDTVGGDTLSDGYTVAPPMDAYFLTGNFTFGDDAELRNITQKTALTGTLNGNKMLSKGSTYRVSGTFTIANGAKLTIPAGTVLKMENNAAIVVNSGGVLNANGTRAAPIVITSINDDSYSGATEGSNHNPQPGDWSKIGINGGLANFDHTYVLYSSRNSTTGAINMNGGCVVFCNGVISHGMYDAVGVESGNFFMTNSVISDCLLAFRHWARDPIVNCIIYDCGRLTQGGSQNFVNCIFSRISETWEAFGFPQGTTYRNCCFWNEDGSVLTGEGTQDAMTVCGKDGNIWGDPLFIDPENGDFRVVAGSPCVDAADSSVAPELDFYGQPRITLTEQTNDTPVVQGQLADIGICEVMPRNVTSDIDLQPVSVRAEEKATPGQLIFVKWTVSNVGGVEVDGSWRDTISLVSENGQQVTLGDKITTSHIAVGGEVFCSAYFTVPAMAEGKWRLKVNVNSYHDIFEGSLFANNALTSDRTVEILLPSIDPAQGSTDGVINAGVPKVLKLTFAEGEENRMVHLDVPAGVKVTYGFGFMPRGNAASSMVVASDAGVRFRVPEGATDVYVTLESDETATFELSYSKDKIVIASVSPNTLPSSGQVTVTITGAGFTSESQVELVNGGKAVAPKSVQYVDTATLVLTVDCATLAAGLSYDVRVSNGENSASSVGAVSVAAAKGEGKLSARLILPESARRGRIVTCYVECANVGTSDMLAPVFIVRGEGALVGLDSDLDTMSDELRLVGVSGSYPAGMLKAGETVNIPFYCLVVDRYSLSLSLLDAASPLMRDSVFPTWKMFSDAIADAATRRNGFGESRSFDYDEIYELAMRRAYGQRSGCIGGVLLDAVDGMPLPNIVLKAVDTNGTVVAEATTKEDGCFQLNFLDDDMVVNLTSEDCQLPIPCCAVVESGACSLTVAAFRKACVSCQLVDPDGRPMAVDFGELLVGGGLQTKVAVDECGCAELHLPDGIYRLQASAEARYVSTGEVKLAVSNGVPSSARLDLPIVEAGRVAISVCNESGDSLKQVEVTLYGAEGEVFRAVGDEDGRYSALLPVGSYSVSVSGGVKPLVDVEVTVEFGALAVTTVRVVEIPFYVFPPVGPSPLSAVFKVSDARYLEGCRYEWDFDSDGSVDSTNNVAIGVFEEEGCHSTTLHIILADGSRKTFRDDRSVEVWASQQIELSDGTVLLDVATSRYDVLSFTDSEIVLSFGRYGLPRPLQSGMLVVLPDAPMAPRKILSAVMDGEESIRLVTEFVEITKAYKTFRVSALSLVNEPQSDLDYIQGMSGLKIPTPNFHLRYDPSGGLRSWSDHEDHYDAEASLGNGRFFIDLKKGAGPYLAVVVNVEDGKLAGLFAGLTGSLNLDAKVGVGFDLGALDFKDRLVGGSAKKEYESMVERYRLMKFFELVPPAMVPVEGQLNAVLEASVGVSADFEVKTDYELACGYLVRGPEKSDRRWIWEGRSLRNADDFNFNLEGGVSVFAGVEPKLGIGVSVGENLEVKLVDAGIKLGARVELKAKKSLSSYVADEYSFDWGMIADPQFDFATMKFGKYFKWTVASFDPKPFEYPITKWKLITPLPQLHSSIKSKTETVATVAFGASVQNIDDWELAQASVEFHDLNSLDFLGKGESVDLSIDDNSWTFEHAFSVRPDDTAIYDVILHQTYQHGVLLRPEKTARTTVRIRGDGVGKEPEVELEDFNGTIPQSCDPNEMVGPMGKGDPETERFVKPGEWMTYTVYFENKADATAAAQEVTVTNPLSEWLDWSTFEMGEVAFNNQTDLGLVGKKNGRSEVTMNGTNYAVRTELKLDEKAGVADWYMRIVDPTTETGWPEDVFAGFLPPNDETFCGEGHLTYRVKVRDDAPKGVRIDNSATIVFDYNPPIETDPAWWNTVAQAQWVKVTVDGVAMTLDLIVGLPYGELPDPGVTPEGHSFGGWFTQPDGKGRQITADSLVEAGDERLCQYWIPIKCEPVLFDSFAPGAISEKGATYNGFLGEDSLGGTFTLVVKKPKKGSTVATATLTKIDPATGKKVKITGTVDINAGVCGGDLTGLELNAQGVGGSLGGVSAQGAVDAAKAKDQDALAVMNDFNKQTYGLVFADAAGEEAYLTATFSTKGKVKVAGTYRGAKVSGNMVMSVGDAVCAVPFVWSKKGVTVAFVLWFDKDKKTLLDVSGLGPGAALVDAGLAGGPVATYPFALDETAVRASVPDAIDETFLPLTVAFNGKKFDAGKAAKVSCKKGVRDVDTSKGDNVTGLKLSYSKGVLKGSFTVYAVTNGKLVKNKFTVAGVLIDGVGYAVGTNKKLPAIPLELAK